MSWRGRAAALAACAFPAAIAGPGRADPLRAPACVDALSALQAREQAVGFSRLPDPILLALRRRAARACLGVRDDLPDTHGRLAHGQLAPGRLAQEPLTAPKAAGGPSAPAIPAPPSMATPPRPVAAPAPPLTTLQCDAVGCTASDGSRLNRMGPNLWGPGGACIALGPVLQCP